MRRVPVICLKCGRHLGEEEVDERFIGNVIFDVCPECKKKVSR